MLVTIRHGQTDYNIKRVFSGKEDTPRLTNEAHLKAYEVGKILKDYNLELAIISPLTRALETFLEINKSINIPYIKDDLLIERDFKEYEGNPISLLNPSVYWNIETPNSIDIESMEDVINRVEECLNKIKKEYPNKNILIIAHSGICRAIKYIVEGKKEKDLSKYEMKNLEVYAYKEW